MSIQSVSRNVVVFADDQTRWHDAIEETKDRELSKFKRVLANCEIVSVLNSADLFEQLGVLLRDSNLANIFVVLDLNFPTVKAGLETLNRLTRNSDERIRQIPVFVYTIGKDPDEISAVFARHGSAFINKYNHPAAFWQTLSNLDSSPEYAFFPNPVRHSGNIDDAKKRPENDIHESCLVS